MLDVAESDAPLSGLRETELDHCHLSLLGSVDVNMREDMVNSQLKHLHLGKLLGKLRQSHPEAFPAVLGKLQQGLVCSVGSSH